MKLYIDTSDSEKIKIGLDGEEFETDSKEKRSQRLLPFIVETLESKGKTIHDLTEIEVFPGPGSFTGLRVGATVAKTLGLALNIPVKADINYK